MSASAGSYRAVWLAAVDVLRETGNPAVMWGDAHLLHEIAERMGWPSDAWGTEKRVMAALNKTPGKLIKKKALTGQGRLVSVFRLPVEALGGAA